MARVLLVDDDDGFCSATKTLLGADGHEVTSAGSIVEAIATLKAHTFDVMLIDLSLPDGSGLQLITDDRPPAVIITGHPSVETAVRALRGPVVDYLIKPVDRAKLNDVLDSLSEADLQPETASSSVDHIIGDSEAIQSLREQILQFGPLNETVLITGESGTGKELVAKALHRARNPKGKLVAINCGAIAPELIASELFGHEKGAFTGATSNRAGVFETAGDGTVFLDEIGELPAEQQVALLRILENRTVMRVGSAQARPITARVVAATNRALDEMVANGDFREDLFFRLMVFYLTVPPLRERLADIPMLTQHLLESITAEYDTPSEATPDVLEAMNEYDWPGNVRELKHTLLRAAILCKGRTAVDELPADFGRPLLLDSDNDSIKPGMAIRDMERMLIEKTLKHHHGKRKETAAALGVSLKTLYNRLKEYEEAGEAIVV